MGYNLTKRILLSLALASATTGAVHAETVIRFAHTNSPDHFVQKSMEKMADAVAKRSNGEIRIEMFPSGQLGEHGQVVEQMTFGSPLMSQIGAAVLADYEPDFSIIVYPFLFDDFAGAKRLLASDLVKTMETEVEDSGIKVMCYAHFGERNLYTRDRIARTPADTAGLSIRVQPTTIYTEMVRQVYGGAATPMPWSEVYSALSQGVMDAAEAPPNAVLDQKHHEVTKYMMETKHIMDIVPVVMTAPVFNDMSPENQAMFREEADMACERMSEASLASYDESIAELEAKGMTIIRDVDRKAFAEKAGGIAASFPEWTPSLYEKVRAIVSNK